MHLDKVIQDGLDRAEKADLMALAGANVGRAMRDYQARWMAGDLTPEERRQEEVRHKAEARFEKAMRHWFFGQKKEVQQALAGRYFEQQWPDDGCD